MVVDVAAASVGVGVAVVEAGVKVVVVFVVDVVNNTSSFNNVSNRRMASLLNSLICSRSIFDSASISDTVQRLPWRRLLMPSFASPPRPNLSMLCGRCCCSCFCDEMKQFQ